MENEIEASNGSAVSNVVKTGFLSIDGTEEDDDVPTLSSYSLAALQEFLTQQKTDLDGTYSGKDGQVKERVELLTEDWRLSQFWYEPATAETVAMEVASLCSRCPTPRVACIACPTLYAYLRNLDPNVSLQLLEYDQRFERYGSDYTFYDYNHPDELPLDFKHGFDVVVADPPYLSKECLEKVAQTISFLSRPGDSFLLLITGEVQKDLAAELLGVRPCAFRPQHSSKLGNEFRVFTNYDPGCAGRVRGASK